MDLKLQNANMNETGRNGTHVFSDVTVPGNSSESPASAVLALWRAQSWYTEGCLDLVNPHWLEFAPQTNLAHRFLAALYVLLMAAGVFGNSLVIFMFIRCRSLRTPANILVTNLAVSDLTMMLKMPVFIYNSLLDGMVAGDFGCKAYGFMGGLTGTVSICTLTAIALDRYYVVVYPLNRSSTTLRAKISICIAWVYGAVFASLPLFNLGFGTYVPEGYLTSCSFDYLSSDESIRNFILIYFVAAWVIPFIIITLCYSKIIRVVVLARNIGSKMQGDGAMSSRHCKEQEEKKKEMRLALVVLAIIGLWFVAWTPYALVALLGIFGQKHIITPLTSMFPALFCKSASCLDPFVYAVTNQKFKEELKTIFCSGRMDRENTNKRVWSTKMSRQPTVRCSNVSSSELDDVEEEVLSMGEPQAVSKVSTPRKGFGRATVTPTGNTVTEMGNLSSVGQTNRASWIFRPSFSNRSSSLRNMARSWNKSREGSVEEHVSM